MKQSFSTISFTATRHFLMFLGVLFLSIATSAEASASTTVEKADSAYNAQNYRMALTLYNQTLATHGASARLYYNIGNTYYRLGNTGKAIVFYERALRLDPSDENARTNLDFVNSTLRGLPEDGSSILSNIHSKVVSTASPDAWGIIALILFLLLLGCVALYLFGSAPGIRKTGFFGGFVVLVLFVYAFVISWHTSTAHERDDIGIVVRENAKLTSNPGTGKNNGDKTVSIPEGSKVEIIDSLSTPNDPVTVLWYNVALNNNTRAWIDATDVEKI